MSKKQSNKSISRSESADYVPRNGVRLPRKEAPAPVVRLTLGGNCVMVKVGRWQ